MPLLSVGINCALGAKEMRPYIEELSTIAPVYVSCYPNAGSAQCLWRIRRDARDHGADLGEFAANGWLNIVGGCCGTTPAHIRAIAEAVEDASPVGARSPNPTPGSADWNR